jgi:glycosyltransferase involved in cell wall biosynthesis
MDAVFAPTHFVEAAVRDRLPDLKVIHYPQAVHVPGDVQPNRAAFGLPDDALVFVMSFDMRSDIERKNPVAAIEAFLQAFPDRKDVRLLIKANNVETIAGLVTRLREVSRDPRVIVLDHAMGYREVLTMYASCDVLVSLHRAEGLGLSLLEAMALGKPVIATGWSGNMDFMTPDNSCTVGFEMIDVVSSTQPAYGKGMSGSQQWANPSIEEAAMWMRRLAEDEELRRVIGAKARADVSAITARYDGGGTLLPALESLEANPAASERMMRLRRRYPVNQARRIARAAVHRLRTRIGLT